MKNKRTEQSKSPPQTGTLQNPRTTISSISQFYQYSEMIRLRSNSHKLRCFHSLSNGIRLFSQTFPYSKRRTSHPSNSSLLREQFEAEDSQEDVLDSMDPIQTKISYDLSKYTKEEQKKIQEFRQNQPTIKQLRLNFKNIGFQNPVSSRKTQLISSDSLTLVRRLQSHYEEQSRAQIDSEPSWAPYTKDVDVETTYDTNFRVSKTSDFLWSLQNKILKMTASDDFVQHRFNYLNDCMNLVNEQKHTLLSIDTKVIQGNLREIGIAIYDPKVSKDSTFPILERYHIIIQEFHGVLSTNSYHGDSLKLSSEDAMKFMSTLFEKHCILPGPEKGAKIVGHSLIDTIRAFRKYDVFVPAQKNDVLDIFLLYMIPFLYQQLPKSESSLKVSTFVELETILKRLQIPYSDIHNSGNRAYFSMFVLLTITNPYYRIKYKLDNIETNLKYMEHFLETELEDILRSWNTRSHVSAETYTSTKQFSSKRFNDYKRALVDVYSVTK